MSEEKYDDRGNLIYRKYCFNVDIEDWYEYDDNNNKIHFKTSEGWESWSEYDKNNNMIYHKSIILSHSNEYWCKYENGNKIDITEQKLKKIKELEFLSRELITRFEIMEL